MKPSLVLLPALTVLTLSSVSAAGKPDFLFQSNMVLGGGRETVFNGTAAAGENVTVKLLGKTFSSQADQDGRYAVTVDIPAPSSKPFDIVISDAQSSVTLTNAVSGLLILAGGQSNMEVPVKEALNPEEEAAAANWPLIREFKVEHDFNFIEQTSLKGHWTPVTPVTAPNVGAIGYYTARMLQRELGGIPVGIINNSYSATSIQPWMPESYLRASKHFAGSLKVFDRFKELGRDGTIARREELGKTFLYEDSGNEGEAMGWHKTPQADWKPIVLPDWLETVYGETTDGAFWFAREFDLPADFAGKDLEFRSGPIDDYDITYFNGEVIGKTGEETPDSWDVPRAYRIPAKLVKPGKNYMAIRVFDSAHAGGFPPKTKICLACGEKEFDLTGEWKIKDEKLLKAQSWPADYLTLVKIYHAGSVLYNAMFAPLKGTRVDAILWYQGESNAGNRNYGEIFSDLITQWRSDLKSEEAPFIFVQLAAYKARATDAADTGDWPVTRAEQAKALALKNVRMVPAIDIGDANRIHPLNKQEVGRRTALWLLQDFFAQDRFKNTIAFPEAVSAKRDGEKIVVELKNAGGLKTTDTRAPQGFSVTGTPDPKTRKVPAVWAKAEIADGKIVVTVPPEIPAPVTLRYAWQMNPDVNTVNALAFPLLPFELAIESPAP